MPPEAAQSFTTISSRFIRILSSIVFVVLVSLAVADLHNGAGAQSSALNHSFITTAIPGFSTYEHLEQDFSVVRNLAYSDSEKKFLADKAFVAQAEFCQQCGQCREDCSKRVDMPALMRSHMYAVQYRNLSMARHLLAESEPGSGLAACGSRQAHCRNTVRTARKIAQLRELQLT